MYFLSSTPKRKHLSNFQKSLTRQGCRPGSSCSGQCACPLVPSSLRWTSNHCQRHWLACPGTTLSSLLLLTLSSLALCWHHPLLHQEWKSADPSAAVWHGSSANWDVYLVSGRQHRPPWRVVLITDRPFRENSILLRTELFFFCFFAVVVLLFSRPQLLREIKIAELEPADKGQQL